MSLEEDEEMSLEKDEEKRLLDEETGEAQEASKVTSVRTLSDRSFFFIVENFTKVKGKKKEQHVVRYHFPN